MLRSGLNTFSQCQVLADRVTFCAALSPFLAAETRAKTRFIAPGSDCVKETEDIMDSSLIAQSCGGQRPDGCDFAG